jgi:hypothetical protein
LHRAHQQTLAEIGGSSGVFGEASSGVLDATDLQKHDARKNAKISRGQRRADHMLRVSSIARTFTAASGDVDVGLFTTRKAGLGASNLPPRQG